MNEPTIATQQFNPTTRVASLLDSILEVILLLTIGLTPLIFSPATSELFEYPKMILVYTLALAGLIVYAAQCFIRKRAVFPSTPLNKPLAAYLAIFILATIFSIHPYTSIMGYYTRFTGGLASVLAYIVLFYLTLMHLSKKDESAGIEIQNAKHHPPAGGPNKSKASNAKRFGITSLNLFGSWNFGLRISDIDEPAAYRLLRTWLLSAAVVSIWSILEHFGHDPSCLILRGSFTDTCWVQDVQARVFGTFGQPNWLAAYLITAIPIGITLILQAQRRSAKFATTIATLLCYAAFWYTYSRSGWFGLGTALVILLLCLPWRTLWDRKFWLGGLLIGCLIVSATSSTLATSRVATSLESGNEDSSTGQIRILLWQGSLQLIKDHPLLGTGPETFPYTFLPYRPAAMNQTTEWNFLYNKAHNEVIQTAATTGLLGLITWLGLFITAFIYLWKLGGFVNLRRFNVFSLQFAVFSFQFFGSRPQTANSKPKTATYDFQSALFAGLIGVFVAQLLGFAVVVTSLYFWLALALIFTPAVKIHSSSISPRPSLRSTFYVLATASILMLATYSLYSYTAAEVLATRASTLLADTQIASAIITGQKAVEHNPFEPTYTKDLAVSYVDLANLQQGNDRAQTLRGADALLQRAYHLNPRDQIVVKGIAYAYQTMAQLDSTYQTQSLYYTKAAWDLAPTDASAAENYADIARDYNQKQASLAAYNQLVQLRPAAAESYIHHAQWYQKYGTPDEYRTDLEHAIKLDPANQDAKAALQLLDTKTLPGDE